MSDISLLNDLTKPATVLIEKIAEAARVLYEPNRIRNNAKAEAEAMIIRAKAEIEITDLQKRAMIRFVQEEGKKQQNMEDVIEKSIPLLNEDSKGSEVEEDWIINFFDKCRLISDEDMQILWAKILAGEANNPNSFSKRTVNFPSSMSKKDAELFAIIVNFCVQIDDDIYPLIFDASSPIYKENGVTFSIIQHLDSIGLVAYLTLGYQSTSGGEPHIQISYFEDVIEIEYHPKLGLIEKPYIESGTVLLTEIGQELIKICEKKYIGGFMDYIIHKYADEQKLKIWSPYPKLARTH